MSAYLQPVLQLPLQSMCMTKGGTYYLAVKLHLELLTLLVIYPSQSVELPGIPNLTLSCDTVKYPLIFLAY